MDDTRKLEAATWYLIQMQDRLYRFASTPNAPGEREALDELLNQYAAAARSGAIICPRFI
jgi:hypothetical protein